MRLFQYSVLHIAFRIAMAGVPHWPESSLGHVDRTKDVLRERSTSNNLMSPSVEQAFQGATARHITPRVARSTNGLASNVTIVSQGLAAVLPSANVSTLLSKMISRLPKLVMERLQSAEMFPTQMTFIYGALVIHTLVFQSNLITLQLIEHILEVLFFGFVSAEYCIYCETIVLLLIIFIKVFLDLVLE